MDKPLPNTPDISLLKASYICPFCATELKGLVNYYSHVAHAHDTTRPLFSGKKARRMPLATELLEAMARAKAGIGRAAKELNVSTVYFKKWAKILIPDEWAEYKSRTLQGVGITKITGDITQHKGYKSSLLVLDGLQPAPKHWILNPHRRLVRLQRFGLLPDSCQLCGFNEHRISDYRAPMLINFLDDDQHNWQLSNLQVLCYNCYFLTVKDMWGKNKTIALRG